MRYCVVAMLVFFSIARAEAQIQKPVTWSAGVKKLPNNEAMIFLKATVEEGWHVYSQNPAGPGGPETTDFTFTPSTGYTLVGETAEPKPTTRFEQVFGMTVSFFEKSVIFQQKVRLKKSAQTIKGTVKFMACNDEQCITPETIPFSVVIK